jgi:hypothetical protein
VAESGITKIHDHENWDHGAYFRDNFFCETITKIAIKKIIVLELYYIKVINGRPDYKTLKYLFHGLNCAKNCVECLKQNSCVKHLQIPPDHLTMESVTFDCFIFQGRQ